MPARDARSRQLDEHRGADAVPLEGVGDLERHLGLVRVGEPVVQRVAHDRAVHQRDDAGVVVLVHVREVAHLALGQLAPRREVAEVARLLGEPGVEGEERVAVGGMDPAHHGLAPVHESDAMLGIGRAHLASAARSVSRTGSAAGRAAPRTRGVGATRPSHAARAVQKTAHAGMPLAIPEAATGRSTRAGSRDVMEYS